MAAIGTSQATILAAFSVATIFASIIRGLDQVVRLVRTQASAPWLMNKRVRVFMAGFTSRSTMSRDSPLGQTLRTTCSLSSCAQDIAITSQRNK